ncbi:epidermal differentiation-specific protein-like isoform X2 [Lissotriton helveticus]
MNTITVYEHPDFKGLYKTFTNDVPRLADHSFEDCITSVKVVGQPWIMYDHPNYQGWCIALEEGEYSWAEMNDRASSLRLITDDLNDPQITVYEHPNFLGSSMVLNQEANLYNGSMNDKISSHRVQRGAWLLYAHPNRSGWSIVARAGEALASYYDVGLNDQVSHVRPLCPGKSSVTATILWDKQKTEGETKIQIDYWEYSNDSESEQQFTVTSTKQLDKVVSHSFEFSNATSIKVGASFTLKGLASIETELSNTFTVKKGETESVTVKQKADLSMPVRIKPFTKATVNFMRKEVTISVPVEVKTVQGTKTVTETGTYRCKNGTNIYMEARSQPITKS